MKRFFVYVFLILFTFLVQNSIFACSPLIEATPNLLLILTFAFGFVRGRKAGLLIGFFGGLLIDMCYGELLGFYAMIYMLIGYVNGMIGHLFYQEFLNMPLLLCVISDFFYNMYIYIFGFLLHGRLDINVYISRVIIPELVYTGVLALVLYPLIFRLNHWLEESEKKNAKRFI